MLPTVLVGVGPRKKRRRGGTLWPKQTTAGLGPFQISDREALLTSYVPVTPDGVE